MTEQPLIKLERSVGLAAFLIVGGVAFACPVILFSSSAFVDGYPQMGSIIMIIFFGSFSIACFVAVYFLGSLCIYSDRLIKYSFLGNPIKIILLNEIVSWEEIENEKADQKQITIRTQKQKFKITSFENGYEDLKHYISNLTLSNEPLANNTVAAKNSQKSASRKVSRTMALVLIVICSWLIYGGFKSYFYPDAEFENLKLSEVAGIAAGIPEIHTGSKSSKWIAVKLKNYPGYTFEIGSQGFYATAKEALHNIKNGDSVFLAINTSEYQKKISKEKDLGFWDKNDRPKMIWVYELKDTHYQYLSLENYILANKEDSKWGLYIGMAAVCLLLWAIRQLRNSIKNNEFSTADSQEY